MVENIPSAVSEMDKFFRKNPVKQLTFASLASIVVTMGSTNEAKFWAQVLRKTLTEESLRSLRRRLATREIGNKKLIVGLLKNPTNKTGLPSRIIRVNTPTRPVPENGKPVTYQSDIYRRIFGQLAA